jgi:2-hydroxy-6-oxonona-2,4-dienedioate hydrolase
VYDAGATGPGGPVVVLAAALGLSSWAMLPLAELFALQFTVHAPDLPGFGRSAKPSRALDVPGLADALAAWMEATGPRGAGLSPTTSPARLSPTWPRATPAWPGAWCCRPHHGRTRPRRPHQTWHSLRDMAHERTNPPPLLLDYRDARPRRVLSTYRDALGDRIETSCPGSPCRRWWSAARTT